MNYNIEVWIKVLETLKYKIVDELSKMGSDINIIKANIRLEKTVAYQSYVQKVDIYFNYKTGEVQSVFIKEHSPFPNHDDKTIKKEDFINEHLNLFRDHQLSEILK